MCPHVESNHNPSLRPPAHRANGSERGLIVSSRGFEPLASSFGGKRSSTELRGHKLINKFLFLTSIFL